MKKFIVILFCASTMLSACAVPEIEHSANSNIEQDTSQNKDTEEEVNDNEVIDETNKDEITEEEVHPEETIEGISNLKAAFYHQNRPQYYADDHLEVSFDEVKNAAGYEVEVSRDVNFEDSKIYELDNNLLFVYSGRDDKFIPDCVNGYYVRARVKGGAWSETVTVGCNVLHFDK